jgi:hypothetical protein
MNLYVRNEDTTITGSRPVLWDILCRYSLPRSAAPGCMERLQGFPARCQKRGVKLRTLRGIIQPPAQCAFSARHVNVLWLSIKCNSFYSMWNRFSVLCELLL